jgi:hypothetical protein
MIDFGGRQKSESLSLDEKETHSPGSSDHFSRLLQLSPRLHSQHLWRCWKHDAIPSLCLSVYRPNLERQELPAERPAPCSTTDGQTEGRDHLSPLGLVAAQQASLLRAISASQHPAMRAHSATQRPSTGRSLSVVVSRTMVKTLGPIGSRSLAVAMVNSNYHGPSRTLSMTVTVRTVADSPPSNYGPSRAQSTNLGSKVLVSASLVSAPVSAVVGTP